MAKQLVVDISPSGTVKIDAQGFNGVGCAEATEQLEIVLGGAGQKTKKKKPEYYGAAGGQQRNKLTF